jgi:ADP-ribose pyrophosphatase YjhB (NUDIX family)
LKDPDWIIWAREIQAIAQTGLAFNQSGYDHERYVDLQALAVRMMAARSGGDPAVVGTIFSAQTGYATPKVDVRGAVFVDSKILLVREVADQHRWTLPGGWADVNLTASENVRKEMLEETGFEVTVRKLAAVWDRARQGHTPQPFHAYKLFFICDIAGGAAALSVETSEIGYFGEHEIPADLSHDRVRPHQIARMFAHWRDPGLPTEYD